jgi:integrase
VDPESVTDGTIASFLQHQKTADIKGTARATVRRAVSAWNSAVERVPGWPQQNLVAPPAQPRSYSLPFEALGEKFANDVARLEARLRPDPSDGKDGLYNSEGPMLDLRPATIRTHLDSLRLAAAALVHSGTAPEAVASLATLVEFENAKRIMDWHFKRSGKRRTVTMRNIANALTLVARHHVGLRGEELQAVLAALKRAKPPKQRELTSRNAALLRQLEDPSRQARLLHLPDRLMRFVAHLRNGGVGARGQERAERPKKAAWLASVAAAIEIELHCPLRLKNLANLRIGTHLQSSQGRGERFTHIVVEPTEVKNGRRIEWELEASTFRLLGRYLREFRPFIARPGSDWLFPNRDRPDRPRSKGSLTKALECAVHEHVGVRLNTHAFRCFAGAMILADNPHAIDDLREVLGHRGFETALVHYRAVASREASRRMNRIVSETRRSTSMIAASAFARLDRSLRREGGTSSQSGLLRGRPR